MMPLSILFVRFMDEVKIVAIKICKITFNSLCEIQRYIIERKEVNDLLSILFVRFKMCRVDVGVYENVFFQFSL